jgi:predicted dinucleotide-binding enzyme
MRIGIVGAGHIGSTLARLLVGLGHYVKIANSRGPETLEEVAADTGALPVAAERCAEEADLVVLSVPMGAVGNLPRSLFSALPASVPLVDTCNYYPHLRDREIRAIEEGLSESRWVAGTVGRPVVKAFNSIIFSSLADKPRPPGAADRVALPVAGDEADAKSAVMELIDAIGFDALDAGSLDESWGQQPGTPGYCTDLDAKRLRQALELADRQAAPERRDLFIERLREAFGRGEQPDIVRLSREVYRSPS